MKRLMWGKSLAAISKKKADGSYDDFKQLPEMVENSMGLNTTKGDKKEAKVEGGGIEAVRYNKNVYGLTADFRRGKVGTTMVTFPFDDDEVDGVVDGVYYLRVQPEDKEAGGLAVEEVIISTEDLFTTADGAIKRVTFDFIKPEPDSGGNDVNTIDWSPIPNLTAAVTTTPGSV